MQNIHWKACRLPKLLDPAITKLFNCFSRGGAKIGRNTKIAKNSHFFWSLNIHNLLERACTHIKQYILKVHLEICLEITCSTIAKYDPLKTGQNEKSYIFKEIDIPEIHVELTDNFENLIAFQAWCLAFTKNFEWLANGTVLGQNNLNSSGGKIRKKS